VATHVTPNLELWRAYRRSKDPALRERLVEAHLALVKFLAARIARRLPRHFRFDDLFSAGLMGSLAAVDDYDPERGVSFSSYASHRIRGAIFDELRRLDWVPRGTRERMRNAQRAIDTLSRRLVRPPTDQEVAKELGIETEAYRASFSKAITLVSLSAAGGSDTGEPSLMDSVEDATSPDPFFTLAERERRAMLARLMDGLPERERQVLALYYYEDLTMREVGTALRVTESRVSQLHTSAVLRLRVMLRKQQCMGAAS